MKKINYSLIDHYKAIADSNDLEIINDSIEHFNLLKQKVGLTAEGKACLEILTAKKKELS